MKNRFKNPLSRMTIKQQMILLFLVLVIPLVVLNFYGNSMADRILKRHVTNAYVELNKQNFKLINRDIETVNKVTSTVIQNALIQQFNTIADESVLSRVKNYERLEKMLFSYSQETDEREPVYYSLYVYDPDNRYFFAPYYPDRRKAGVYFFSDEDEKPVWFDEAVALKGNGYLKRMDYLSPPVKGQRDQQTLSYVRAINNIYQGGTIGVLVVTNLDARIGESLSTVSIPDGELYLTDWNNNILTSSNKELTGILELPPEAENVTSSIGVMDVIASDFIYVIDYNYVIQQKLIYKVPIKALLAQQNEIKRVIQVISIAYFVVGLILVFYFWQSLMTPLQKLVTFVRRYEPGNIVPQTPYRRRKDEVSVLISTIYDMARRLNDMIHYKYNMDLKQKEAQLQLLYQQINPHLLYNTLESIYWKSTMEGNTESAEMIKDLSKLMKISLSRGRDLITLEEEMEHARAYINLQLNRYDYQFSVQWDIPDVLFTHLIPKITLQPLLENAIIHGIKNMGDDGIICVTGRRDEEETCRIIIEDNGFRPVNYESIRRLLYDEVADHSLGYGIRNIHERLQLHFGREYGLQYEPGEDGGTRVIITIPHVHPTARAATEQEVS
ncbi:two-component system sensor histidine kinase YesM [Paenibacillus sp. JCM 10914]|uniref:sensor histidine kinase n=1 Tax=Paenibacillus sp. JCM 10914 TaxID=1236974 RepID=UPI0003CC58C0|nr:sensor histidine kinase [Paenibacillus sp. JCM 10914]GAE08246.1 two-component sensor histidine kinase [Paenibacillus sp. JCM 10914]